MRASFVAVLFSAVVLAGCGGSGGDGQAEKHLTVPNYGQFPAMTVPVTQGTAEQCRAEADAFSRAAEGFLRPFPSDADNYRVLARVQFIAFKAHLCDTGILREAVTRRLTAKQVHEVLRFFGFMGDDARALQPAPQY
ncbi:MAG TPA: hypothetical protein VGF10_02815 [Gaiella sp.]|jgi:hypothetical protein